MNEKLNSRIPNIRHLRAFSEVARYESISLAADKIHLSQPAITQALAKLEENLGVKLFDRRSDGMELTKEGAIFLQRVLRTLKLIKNGARDAVRLGSKKGNRGFAQFDQLLTLPQLRALVAVSKAGNFSLAARIAGVSQPTIHRAARDLECLSGISLFVKNSKGIELTPAAEALTQSIKLGLAELEQGFAEIDELLGVDSGNIVIGAMPLPRTYVLPTAINALLNKHPETHLKVVDGPYNDLLHGLRHGEIDLLIGALRDPVPIDDIVQEELFSDPLSIVGRAGHPLSQKSTILIDDLSAFSWAVPRQGTPTRKAFNSLFQGREVPSRLVESSSLVLVRGLLLESDHLTLLSTHQIRLEKQLGLLTPLAFDLSSTSRPIGITTRKDWRPTATQRLLLNHLRQASKQVHKE